eukprot:1094680-Prorocentrum_minimum.AAC.1
MVVDTLSASRRESAFSDSVSFSDTWFVALLVGGGVIIISGSTVALIVYRTANGAAVAPASILGKELGTSGFPSSPAQPVAPSEQGTDGVVI